MVYYTKDNKLYAMDAPVEDDSFIKITEDEYNERVLLAAKNREKSSVVFTENTDNED